jgi:hypothetical protein
MYYCFENSNYVLIILTTWYYLKSNGTLGSMLNSSLREYLPIS